MRSARFATIALATAWLGGCRPASDSSTTPAPAALPSRPNIVFILIDAVRADHLGIYGYPKETMPFVAGLAARGLVFERAYAPSSWTPSAMASIFTGRWVHQHGVLSGFAATKSAWRRGETVTLNRVPAELATLPEVLKAGGYRTFGAADNMNLGDAMGFTRGFDVFSSKDQGGLRHGKTVAEWRPQLLSGGPYFLYLHFMAAHAPYRKRAPWYDPETPPRLQDVAAYDSNLSFMDQEIRELFEALDLEQHSVVIVTADHGEEFGDHGGFGHKNTLYEELLRVPLVLFGPGQLPGGRVKSTVSTIDLLPTLRDLLRLPEVADEPGRSLLQTARTGGDASRVLFPMRCDEFGPKAATKKAVVTQRHKLILTEPDGREELYDLLEDPGERHDLAAQKPALVAALRNRLEEMESRTRAADREYAPPVPISKEQAEELRALGYVR